MSRSIYEAINESVCLTLQYFGWTFSSLLMSDFNNAVRSNADCLRHTSVLQLDIKLTAYIIHNNAA